MTRNDTRGDDEETCCNRFASPVLDGGGDTLPRLRRG